MDCVDCGSAEVTEQPGRATEGYRRLRCRDCSEQFHGRRGGPLNHAQYPSNVIALVVLWRLRYRLTLHNLSEMPLVRGIVFGYEAAREWDPSARRYWPTNSAVGDMARTVLAAANGTSMRPT